MLHEPIETALNAVIREMGIGEVEIDLQRPRNPSHGDVTCNIALVLSGKLGRPSCDLSLIHI